MEWTDEQVRAFILTERIGFYERMLEAIGPGHPAAVVAEREREELVAELAALRADDPV